MEHVVAPKFQCARLTDIPTIEDLTKANKFLHDIDIVDEVLVGELARRCIEKVSNTVRLLCYGNHIPYFSDNNIFFKNYRFSPCSNFNKGAGNQSGEALTSLQRNS